MSPFCLHLARRSARALAIAALTLPAIASAVLVTGPGGTAEQGRRTVSAAPAVADAASAPSLDLVSARLDAVDAAAGRVVVNSKSVALDRDRLRVIGTAGQRLAGASALAAGQQIRFALEPGTAPVRRIVLIYIDR